MQQPVLAILQTTSTMMFVKGNCLYSLDGNVFFKHSSAFTGVCCYAADSSHQIALADATKTVLFIDGNDWTVKGCVRIAKSPTAISYFNQHWFIADRFGDISKVDGGGNQVIFGGSVSTLTDLVCHSHQVLASDRDEKIKSFDVQTGDLNGFLLSHKSYVSCLCLTNQEPQRLVSAGGDPFVCIWSLPVHQTVCRPEKQIAIKDNGVLSMCSFAASNIALIYDDCNLLTIICKDDDSVTHYELEAKLASISHHDAQLVLGTLDGDVWFCSVDDGKVLKKVSLPQCDMSLDASSLFKSKYRKGLLDEEGAAVAAVDSEINTHHH